MTQGALFRHFPSKDAIWQAVMEWVAERLIERIERERALVVIRILHEMAHQYQTAVIVVTHDEKIIPTFRRIYQIRDGHTHEQVGEGRPFR